MGTFLTRRIQAVQPSATLALTARAKALKAEGKPVVSLAAGEPDFDTPQEAKAEAVRAIEEGFTKYTATTGMPALKRAVSDYFSVERKLAYAPDQINITCGAKQALYSLLQVLVDLEQEVLIPSPYWVSYPEMVRLAGGTPVEIRTDPQDGFRLSPEAVERACTDRTKVLIINSPANPTGAVLDADRLKGIGEVVRRRGLWVISDEIYCQLAYGKPAPSLAAVVPELKERTLIVDGVSKAYAMTGWRIGFLAGPTEVVKAAARLQDHSTSGPASISQRAALAALTGPQETRRKMRRAFQERRDLLVSTLRAVPGISFTEPEGAFYCFVEIAAAGLDSTAFAEQLLREKEVAVIPGAGFGWDTHIRLSFALDTDGLAEGLQRLRAFVESRLK